MSVASKGPDFLVIGAQRAGTTWLHRVLQRHPALWLPPVKELHYFDKLDIERTILNPKERRRIGLKRLLSLDPWLLTFWFGSRSDEWYASLFSDARARGLIAGEITPAYATLDETVLQRIRRMNDKIKLIFVMRDPVDRVWSAVNNAAKKGADATTVEKSIKHAREWGAVARSGYSDTIKRMEAVFPVSQIHYCFFDDLRDRPKSLTSDLLTFLGVEPAPVPLQLPSAVNVAAVSKAVPPEFSREMARDYLDMVQQLCRRFQGPPHKWRARYEKLLDVRTDAPAAAAGTK
jgi:hypothetical protein